MRPTYLLITVAAITLAACGSDPNEGASTMPDETTDSTPTSTDASAQDGSTPASPPATAATTIQTPTPPTVSAPEDADTTDPAASSTVPSDTTEPERDPTGSTPGRVELLATTDLADRLGLDVNEIKVIEHEEVTWRDASLGCPQKDFQYVQVLTPGVRIVLSAEGSTYSYHGGAGRDPFYCIDPQPPA